MKASRAARRGIAMLLSLLAAMLLLVSPNGVIEARGEEQASAKALPSASPFVVQFRPAAHILDDQQQILLILENVIQRGNVWMRKSGGRARFAQ